MPCLHEFTVSPLLKPMLPLALSMNERGYSQEQSGVAEDVALEDVDNDRDDIARDSDDGDKLEELELAPDALKVSSG